MDSILWKIEQNNTNYIPQIYIKLNQEAKTLEIRDNGIGISREDFLSIFKPNFSLKKYKQQSSARGHKGAATTYLQFAHGSYDIYVKDQTGSNHLSLANGAEWLNSFSEYISAGSANETVPEPAWTYDQTTQSWLDTFDSGCIVKIKFNIAEHVTLFEVFLKEKRLQ